MNLGPADIDDYCVRIGYSGPREPTAEALRGDRRRKMARAPGWFSIYHVSENAGAQPGRFASP